MDIGSKIRELRTKRNFTQEELAQKLSVTAQAISRWECGISLPDISMIPLLTRTLFVSADELLGCDSSQIQIFESCNSLDCSGDVLNQAQVDSIFEMRRYIPDGTSKNILIVDDSDFMRMMLKNILTEAGHLTVEADNGKTAIKVLAKEKVDVCILDIKMPEMNGIDALKQIVSEYGNIKVIMLSALSCESIVREAFDIGAASFIVKPFQADSVIKRV